jgi:hypothetical protein
MIKHPTVTSFLLATLLVLFVFATAHAQGGPPMLTDDSDTPGNHRWELNLLFGLEKSRHAWEAETPKFDLNYGLGNRIQLKVEAPFVVKKETGEHRVGGPGNATAGIKWRFHEDEENGFDMSIYPQVAFNTFTSSERKGLVEKGTNLFLPVEAVKKFGEFKMNGELGYRLVHDGSDEFQGGLLVGRAISHRTELMAEIHGSTLRTIRESEFLLNFGTRIELTKNSIFMFSAGRSIRNIPGEESFYIASVGLRINFGRTF